MASLQQTAFTGGKSIPAKYHGFGEKTSEAFAPYKADALFYGKSGVADGTDNDVNELVGTLDSAKYVDNRAVTLTAANGNYIPVPVESISSTDVIEMYAKYNTLADDDYLLGARQASPLTAIFFGLNVNVTHKWALGWGSGFNTSTFDADTDWHLFRIEAGKLYVDGVQVCSVTNSTFTIPFAPVIGARYRDDAATGNNSDMSIGYFAINGVELFGFNEGWGDTLYPRVVGESPIQIAGTIGADIWDNDQDDYANSQKQGFTLYEYDSNLNAEITEYYDGRSGSIAYSVDDLTDDTVDDFVICAVQCRSFGIWVTIGVITDRCSPATWAKIQAQIDLGYVSVASHSYNHDNPDNYPGGTEAETKTWADLDTEVLDSFVQIEAALTLPEVNRYNGYNKVGTWIQPYGTRDGTSEYHTRVMALLSSIGVTIDRNIGGSTAWNEWDSELEVFGRIGVSITGYNIVVNPAKVLSDISSRGNGSTYHHPYDSGIYKRQVTPTITDATPDPTYSNPDNLGYYIYKILEGIKDQADVWYCALDHLYWYRYLSTVAELTVTNAEDNSSSLISVAIPVADRERLGLGIPLTVKWENTLGLVSADLNVYYKKEGELTYTALTEKTTSDKYDTIDAWRRDGDDFYISMSPNETGSSFSFVISETAP